MNWRNRSLIYPSLAFLLVAILATLAIGYFINYTLLRDVLHERVSTKASLITGNIQSNLSGKVDRITRFKDSWLTSMAWLAHEPGAETGDETPFAEKWERIQGFFPLWNLDFLLVLDPMGQVTHRLPETFALSEPFSGETMQIAKAKVAETGYWQTMSRLEGQWRIQIFMPVNVAENETRLLVFGFLLKKMTESLQAGQTDQRFLLADERALINRDDLMEAAGVDWQSVRDAIADQATLITLDEKLDWNLYYTPIQILDRTLCLIIPVNIESAKQILSNSRERLAASGLFIIVLLILIAVGMNMLILSPLHRLREKAAALIAVCSATKQDLNPGAGKRGNEIDMLEQALKSASTKLYAHLTQLRESNELLESLSLKDPVTGLLNDKMFHELLHRALLESRRKSRDLAVFIIELDRLEPAWEEVSDDQAAQLLRELTGRLAAIVRGEDLLFRTGSRQLAVYIPECKGKPHILDIARRIEHSITRTYTLAGVVYQIQVSIGISRLAESEDTVEDLIAKAHQALQAPVTSGEAHIYLAN